MRETKASYVDWDDSVAEKATSSQFKAMENLCRFVGKEYEIIDGLTKEKASEIITALIKAAKERKKYMGPDFWPDDHPGDYIDEEMEWELWGGPDF